MARYLVRPPAAPEPRASRELIERALADGGPFWLDIRNPKDEDFELLRQVFGFHPLAIEDSEHFGQRPKLDEFGDFVLLVFFGYAPDDDGIAEVHCFASERFLVTVHRDASPALDRLRERCAHGALADATGAQLLYHVVDELVDGFFPALDELAGRLDAIEDALLTKAREEHLNELLALRHRLLALQRVVGPQRDLIGRVLAGIDPLPGLDAELERYYRDVYDHLIRLDGTIDSNREQLVAATGIYLSSASNRLNDVVKKLTVIATIFLPLTWLTGFFGQNFGWLVEHVGGLAPFLGLGIGLELLAVIAMLAYFRRQGWF